MVVNVPIGVFFNGHTAILSFPRFTLSIDGVIYQTHPNCCSPPYWLLQF